MNVIVCQAIPYPCFSPHNNNYNTTMNLIVSSSPIAESIVDTAVSVAWIASCGCDDIKDCYIEMEILVKGLT